MKQKIGKSVRQIRTLFFEHETYMSIREIQSILLRAAENRKGEQKTNRINVRVEEKNEI